MGEKVTLAVASKNLGVMHATLRKWAKKYQGKELKDPGVPNFPCYGKHPMLVIVEEVQFWMRLRAHFEKTKRRKKEQR